MFAIWLCVVFSTIKPGTGTTHSLKYKQHWAKCSEEIPFLTHWNIAMEKCVSECNTRKACLAVNYWTRRLQCDMLLEDTENPLPQEHTTQPCVFVRKTEFEPYYRLQLPSACAYCNETTACDSSGECKVKECRRLQVPNATIKGNILSVGSKIRIDCNHGWVSNNTNETLSICKADGTWSYKPTCHIQLKCPTDWFIIGNSSYCYPNDDATRTDVFSAIDYCHSMSGYLVQFETETEAINVEQYLFSTYVGATAWLGITDNGTEKTWRWMETNETATFLDWRAREPDGGTTANYARLRPDGEWGDNSWSTLRQPMCEKSLTSP